MPLPAALRTLIAGLILAAGPAVAQTLPGNAFTWSADPDQNAVIDPAIPVQDGASARSYMRSLRGVMSGVKQALATRGQPNGLAGLGADGKLDPLLLDGRVPRVASAAALVDALPLYRRVYREGFYTEGDGGEAAYTYSSAPCSLNGGLGDSGAQVRSSFGGCWLADLSKPVSIKVWGAKMTGASSADIAADTAAANAAVAAMGTPAIYGARPPFSGTSGTILIPGTGNCLYLSAKLQINVSNITFLGHSPQSSCFNLQFTNDNGVQSGDATHSPFNNSFRNIGFYSDAAFSRVGLTTPYASLEFFNGTNNEATNITCFDYYMSCIGHDKTAGANSSDTYLERIVTQGLLGIYGITIGAQGDETPVNVRVKRAELAGNGYGRSYGAAFNLQNVGGLFIDEVNTSNNYRGIWIHPTGNRLVSGVYSSNTWIDEQQRQGLYVDTSGVTSGRPGFTNSKFANLWIATCGTQPVPDSCILFEGPANSVENITADVQVFNVQGHGAIFNTGRDIQISGAIAAASMAQPGTYHGILLSGVQRFSWSGRIGGSSGPDAVFPFDTMNCAVRIPAANVDSVLLKGDFSDVRHAPQVCDDSTPGAVDYAGVIPGQPWLTFTPQLSCASGALATSGQSAAMRYQLGGKTVRFTLKLVAGSGGSCSGLRYTLPFTPATDPAGIGATVFGTEASTKKGVTSSIVPGSALATTQYFDGTATGANGTTVTVSGQYERQ